MKRTYLIFAVFGAILPFVFFGDFILAEGTNVIEFAKQLFANAPASGFTVDLLITSEVFWLWSFYEVRRLRMRNWWMYVVLNLTVVLSCALPLFLALRHARIQQLDGQRPDGAALGQPNLA